MSFDIRLDLRVTGASFETFSKLSENIGFLTRYFSEQPPLDISPTYKDSKIDYEDGFRVIEINESHIGDRTYRIRDHAPVSGVSEYMSCVGTIDYTQEQIDELRKQNS